uniref:Bm6487 n=1 Tax=Brugia malayi TaxID=6279 RepID=A0A0I9N823_BRUMA|nr:Bm6487 [Brugia malayi]
MEVEIDEVGCPRKIHVNITMQTGEIFTYMLGIFAIILIISTMLYYRYCKKRSTNSS